MSKHRPKATEKPEEKALRERQKAERAELARRQEFESKLEALQEEYGYRLVAQPFPLSPPPTAQPRLDLLAVAGRLVIVKVPESPEPREVKP